MVGQVWNHTFYNELRVSPEDQPVIISGFPFSSQANRDKIAEIMFETNNVPALYIANRATLGFYNSQRVTGILVQSGADVTYVVPIYEGFALYYAAQHLHLGGRTLTKFLIKMLTERGFCFPTDDDRYIANDIKEFVLCFFIKLIVLKNYSSGRYAIWPRILIQNSIILSSQEQITNIQMGRWFLWAMKGS